MARPALVGSTGMASGVWSSHGYVGLQVFYALDAEELRREWETDPRFATNTGRMGHLADLVLALEERLVERDTDEWVELLLDAGVPAGPIRDYEQSCADPHTLAREMVVELDHPVEGRVRALGIPVKLSETAGTIRRVPPRLGEHTDEILRAAGYSPAEIEAMREEGAVA